MQERTILNIRISDYENTELIEKVNSLPQDTTVFITHTNNEYKKIKYRNLMLVYAPLILIYPNMMTRTINTQTIYDLSDEYQDYLNLIQSKETLEELKTMINSSEFLSSIWTKAKDTQQYIEMLEEYIKGNNEYSYYDNSLEKWCTVYYWDIRTNGNYSYSEQRGRTQYERYTRDILDISRQAMLLNFYITNDFPKDSNVETIELVVPASACSLTTQGLFR